MRACEYAIKSQQALGNTTSVTSPRSIILFKNIRCAWQDMLAPRTSCFVSSKNLFLCSRQTMNHRDKNCNGHYWAATYWRMLVNVEKLTGATYSEKIYSYNIIIPMLDC